MCIDDDADSEGIFYLFSVPIVLCVVLITCGYYIQYEPTHHLDINQLHEYESILDTWSTNYNCPVISQNNYEYKGNLSCNTFYKTIDYYEANNTYTCGAGQMCDKIYGNMCSFTYSVYTNDNTGISGKLVKSIPGQFYYLGELSNCQHNPISVNGIILDYKCDYASNPKQLYEDYLYTNAASYRPPIYIYIQANNNCEPTCGKTYENRQQTIKVNTCKKIGYKIGIIVDKANIVSKTYTYICAPDDQDCETNYYNNVMLGLKPICYNKLDSQLTYTCKEFGYKSAIAMFVFGSIFGLCFIIILCTVLCIWYKNR
jgi:hypothetical protein